MSLTTHTYPQCVFAFRQTVRQCDGEGRRRYLSRCHETAESESVGPAEAETVKV